MDDIGNMEKSMPGAGLSCEIAVVDDVPGFELETIARAAVEGTYSQPYVSPLSLW